MDIKGLQEKVIEFRDQRDWGQYHNPKDLALSICLEAAELLEIFQWKNAEQVERLKTDETARTKVKEELGDVLIYALTLAHEFGFDPGDVIQNKMQLNNEKYPVEKVKGRSDKYTVY